MRPNAKGVKAIMATVTDEVRLDFVMLRLLVPGQIGALQRQFRREFVTQPLDQDSGARAREALDRVIATYVSEEGHL